MSQTEYEFTRSYAVIKQLAGDSARTPPSEGDSPFGYVDRSLTILGRTFDTHSQRIRQEFLGQREFIASQSRGMEKRIDRQFEQTVKRSEEMERSIEKRFERVDRQFKEIDKQIGRRSEELDDKMRQRLEYMQNASRNILRTRGWEAISPVGSFDLQGRVCIPDYFPRTVKHFWRLKEPSQMDHLIYLARFYKLQGYDEWGKDTDSLEGGSDTESLSEDSSGSSGIPIPLEVAVRSHPETAHRALAAHLGLSYDGIQNFMERAQKHGQTQWMTLGKRGQGGQIPGENKKRNVEKSDGEGTEVTSPTEPLSSQPKKTSGS